MSVKPKKNRPTMAEQADIHELYEESVQNVENEVEFMQTTFRELRGRDAFLFRAYCTQIYETPQVLPAEDRICSLTFMSGHGIFTLKLAIK